MHTDSAALFIIFGGSGDLAQRKLYPALFNLYRKGYLKEHFAVIGTARRPWTDEHYHEIVMTALDNFDEDQATKEAFVGHFYYQSHDVTDAKHYETLKALASRLDEQYDLQQNRIYYMAMSPRFFGTIASHLGSAALLTTDGFNRLIIEKPFGRDYDSAKALNQELTQTFDEDQIYRIDHYLGKEMIQNIVALRFGNGLLSGVWNNQFIDNVQITLAESVGVEERAGYYETSGALRDMFQNHIMQVIGMLAMEVPVNFTAEDVQREKTRLFRSIQPYSPAEIKQNFVRAQYAETTVDGENKPGYQQEINVAPDSQTETFVAGKVMIDNERWCGVPFYVRTGKRLARKETQINIVFKKTGVNIFADDKSDRSAMAPDVLTIYVEPEQGFSLTINGKEVGQGFALKPDQLTYQYDEQMLADSPEAYERLILEALNGDGTNFTHWHELAASWQFVDAIREVWDADQTPLPSYAIGSMGPQEATDLLATTGAKWIFDPTQNNE